MLNCSTCFRRLTVTVFRIVLPRLSLITISTTYHLIKLSTISVQSSPNLRIIRDSLKCYPLDLVLIDWIVNILVVVEEEEIVEDVEVEFVEIQFVEEEEVVVVEESWWNPIFGLKCLKKTLDKTIKRSRIFRSRILRLDILLDCTGWRNSCTFTRYAKLISIENGRSIK